MKTKAEISRYVNKIFESVVATTANHRFIELCAQEELIKKYAETFIHLFLTTYEEQLPELLKKTWERFKEDYPGIYKYFPKHSDKFNNYILKNKQLAFASVPMKEAIYTCLYDKTDILFQKSIYKAISKGFLSWDTAFANEFTQTKQDYLAQFIPGQISIEKEQVSRDLAKIASSIIEKHIASQKENNYGFPK